MNWKLPNVFHFTKLEKLQVFLLKPDLIRKLHLLKLYALVTETKHKVKHANLLSESLDNTHASCKTFVQ